jgi:hypothetical protein
MPVIQLARSSSPIAFCGTRRSSAAKTSLPARIAASAAGSTRTLPGPSCACLSKGPPGVHVPLALVKHARGLTEFPVQAVAGYC